MENVVLEQEKYWLPTCSPLLIMFSKVCLFKVIKNWGCWQRVNKLQARRLLRTLWGKRENAGNKQDFFFLLFPVLSSFINDGQTFRPWMFWLGRFGHRRFGQIKVQSRMFWPNAISTQKDAFMNFYAFIQAV